MRQHQHIKSFSTACLLVLFTLSVTPKSLLHNLFADHKDSGYSLNPGRSALLGQAVFNCHCDDLVVDMPYFQQAIPSIETPVLDTDRSFTALVYHFYQQHHFYSELRGPPSLIA